MGIDAEILIKYRGEKPGDDQLTRWSWDLCQSIGAKHFFIADGLPPGEYRTAMDAWNVAFNAHPAYPAYKAAGDNRDLWDKERTKILADIGEPPKELRRALELTNRRYPLDDDSDVPEVFRTPGLAWSQDGPPVLAAPGEWFMEVSLRTRYYGEGYERGDILTLCAIAEWLEANLQPCEVWYGGDSSGVLVQPFGPKRRAELRHHLYSASGRDYFKYEAPVKHPTPCGLCIPGEVRMTRNGWGKDYHAVSCGGCGKRWDSRDDGATWAERKDD